MPINDQFFTSFELPIAEYILPDRFVMLLHEQPHPLCLAAAVQLQQHLEIQNEWEHNFGLSHGQEGTVIGKMFGVLVVETREKEIGYLAAFSGKLAGGNHHAKFVPPVFDTLAENSFLHKGMKELTEISKEIQTLKDAGRIAHLRSTRKKHSVALQKEIFDQYHFLNQAGEEKSLYEIFQKASYKNPPSGAGECAAPKLLQYAFQQQMKPLAIAEFWWGLSPKSALWQHKHFYPCCREKCAPILDHMLEGMDFRYE